MSTSFLEKSKDSLESAQFLIDEGKNNSSVHCAYYSCVQVLLYILHNEIGLTASQLKNEISQYLKNKGKGGSHAYYIGRIINDLTNRNSGALSSLNTELVLLKKARVEADYTPTILTEKDASKAYNRAEIIIQKLSTDYNLPK